MTWQLAAGRALKPPRTVKIEAEHPRDVSLHFERAWVVGREETERAMLCTSDVATPKPFG